MKNLFTISLFTLSLLICKAQLPNPALIGYWHNWNDINAPYIHLDSVDDQYNVIEIAFAMPTSPSDMHMTFTPDMVSIPTFKAKIQSLHSKGKKVLISVGGATASIDLTTTLNKDAFVNTMTAIIDTFDFDGIDIDIESGNSILITAGNIAAPTNMAQINLIDAIKEIMANYRASHSKKLLLTMAPETAYVQGGQSGFGSIWGGYLPIIHALRDSLDLLQVQLYNSGSMYGINGNIYTQGTADFIIAMTEAVIKGFNTSGGLYAGLPANKVAVGLPACSSAAGGGFIDTATVRAALIYLMGKGPKPGSYVLADTNGYPTLRGMMTWSINWDAVSSCASKYEYALNYDKIFGCASKPGPPAPANTSSSANQSICSGTKTILSALGTKFISWYSDSIGGTYLGSGDTFSTPLLFANKTYYAQDSTCKPSIKRTAISVTVKNLPTVTANASDTAVCAGKSVTLNGGGNASSYAWSGGITNGIAFVPTLPSSSYTVTGTSSNGCTDTAQISISVKALPTVIAIASDTIICAGKSITLTGGGTATSFVWSSGKSNGISFVPALSATSYTVTGTGANGCSDTAKISIQVKPLPTSSTSVNGNSITANENGASYQWMNCTDKSIIPGANAKTFTANAAGKFAVIVSKNNCTDTSACVDVFMTSIAQNSLNQLVSIYPNPNNGACTIESKAEGLFTIQNELGQIIQTNFLNSNNHFRVKIENLHNGIYFVVGTYADQQIKRKIIVQNNF